MIIRHRARQRGLEVNPLDGPSTLAALAEQVGKVLARNVALVLDFADLVLALAEFLGGELERGLESRGGHAEDAADFGGNARGVEVDVVHFREGGGDFAREADGEGFGDLGDEVCAG